MNKAVYRSISVILSITLMLGSYFSAGASAAFAPKMVYVNPAGSDSNSGSASSPFKTLSKGVSVLVAGDTLNITGTFNMPLIVSKSGTASAPITIIGSAAILNMNNAQGNGIYISGSYINASGFDVMGATGHGVAISGKHVKFENSSVHNSVASNGVEACTGTSSGGWGSGLKVLVGADDVVLRGNSVYENCGEGIAVTRGINVLVENNTVYDNYSVNIYIDNSHHVQVLNNYSYCANPNYYRSGAPATGILLGNEEYSGWGSQLHDVLIDRNMVQKCKGIRLYNPIAGAISNLTITNNVFNSVASPFVNVPGAVVSNNISGTTTLPTPTITKTSIPVTATKTSVLPTATKTPILPTATKTPILPTVINPTVTVPVGQNSVDVRVTSGNDDVEESAGGWVYVDSSDLELVYDANTQIIGLRFNGVNIPKNAIILKAYVQFKAEATSSTATILAVQGEISPNAAAFATTTRNLSSRARTLAAITWTPVAWLTAGAKGTGQQTPNIAPVIQEIVGQAGWVAGNSLAIIISGNGKRAAHAYEGDAAGAPLLHIEYTTSTALDIQQIAPLTATPTASLLPVLPTATPEATSQPVSEVIYDDTNSAFVFSPGWQDFAAQQANGGSYKATTIQDASATLGFTGQSFSILYTDGQSYKGMSVYVDGVLVETIYRKTNTITYQQRWDYPGQLSLGAHTVQLVFVNGYGSLDAVIIR